MSERIATMSMDGTPISQADIERIEQEERAHARQKSQAARVVAGGAVDVDDCRLLLDILGLDHEILIAARNHAVPVATTVPVAKTPGRRSRAA